MGDAEKNINRAAHFFICTIWIQSQMADLIVLRQNPDLLEPFLKTPKQIPRTMSEQRLGWMQKTFAQVIAQFEKEFCNKISDQFDKDIKTVFHLRNAIAHSHVSLGRSYMLFRPDTDNRMARIEKDMTVLEPPADMADPPVLKLDFCNDKIYLHNFDAITRLDQEHLRSIAEYVGIPHSRIR